MLGPADEASGRHTCAHVCATSQDKFALEMGTGLRRSQGCTFPSVLPPGRECPFQPGGWLRPSSRVCLHLLSARGAMGDPGVTLLCSPHCLE